MLGFEPFDGGPDAPAPPAQGESSMIRLSFPLRSRPRLRAFAGAIALLAVLPLVAGCGRGGGEGGGGRQRPISVKGSDTMVILGQKWADEYMKAHEGTVVAVTGGGSGTGIAQLINGTADIAQSSRPMKDEEKAKIQETTGAPVSETAVARDGVTIYVHTSNPLAQVTMDQLKGIYTGTITNWKDLGGADRPIVVYSRENNSGTYVFFKEHVLGGDDFMPGAQTLPGTAAVVNAVSRDPNGIGYGGIAYGTGIKHVGVAGAGGGPVEATEATIKDGTYPLSRPLYWYMTSKAPEAAKTMRDWVLSAEGQAHVQEVGYFPVH
jgi:phosphate transport system substrate-binding protein